MSTFTASPNTDTGAVDLSLDMEANTVLSITRSNYNGVASVRAAAGQLPSPLSGTTILSDYEAAQGLNDYAAVLGQDLVEYNYSPNPSPTSPNGWGTTSSYVKTWEASRVGRAAMVYTKSGIGSYLIYGRRAGTSTTSTSYNDPAEYTVIKPGQTAYVSLDLGTAQAGTEAEITIRFTDAAFNSISSSKAPAAPLTANVWKTFTHSATAPDTAAYFWIEWAITFTDGSQTVGGEVTFASRALTALSPVPYFSGNTSSTGTYGYAWKGTANDSWTARTTKGVQQITASTSLDLGGKPWLLVPIAPNYSEQVETITGYTATRDTSSTVHNVIGRPDPVVVMGKLGTRKGSLEVFTKSLADAARVARVFDRGEVVLVKQGVPGLDMYLAALSLDLAPYQVQGEADTRYKLTVDYREVVRPPGDLAGALGWTFDALAQAHVTFDAQKASYATFDNMTLGDRK